MRTSNVIHRSLTTSFALLACGLIYAVSAQTAAIPSEVSAQEQTARPTVMLPQPKGPAPIAVKTELYCAGFIQYAPAQDAFQIVGGEQEQEKRAFAGGDYVFINAGAQQGIRAGQEFSIVRPRGQFTTKFTRKKGWLGVYTQELGQLRVKEVRDQVSVALITSSCDMILFGDLLRAIPERAAPIERAEAALDRFQDQNGKPKGRIVLARDGREMVSRDDVVFIDLGFEDKIKPGDYFTIYRKAGTGNITRFRDEEITPAASGGFQSDRFRGGKFSSKAQRVKSSNETGAFGPTINTPDVISRRPAVPRKVVGELVVLSVQERTATAIITRVSQEVHTGDFVELQ